MWISKVGMLSGVAVCLISIIAKQHERSLDVSSNNTESSYLTKRYFASFTVTLTNKECNVKSFANSPTISTKSTDFSDGASYKACSRGVLNYPDGRRYEAEWNDNKMRGQGSLATLDDGSTYDGECEDYKRTGRATMTYPDERRYNGELKEDKPCVLGSIPLPMAVSVTKITKTVISAAEG